MKLSKKDSKPEKYSLLPWDAVDEVARVYGEGAAKYGDRNWEIGNYFSTSLDALGRHYADFQKGEDRASDNNCHHLASVAFHALAIIAWQKRGIGIDDRSKKPKGQGKPKRAQKSRSTLKESGPDPRLSARHKGRR